MGPPLSCTFHSGPPLLQTLPFFIQSPIFRVTHSSLDVDISGVQDRIAILHSATRFPRFEFLCPRGASPLPVPSIVYLPSRDCRHGRHTRPQDNTTFYFLTCTRHLTAWERLLKNQDDPSSLFRWLHLHRDTAQQRNPHTPTEPTNPPTRAALLRPGAPTQVAQSDRPADDTPAVSAGPPNAHRSISIASRRATSMPFQPER